MTEKELISSVALLRNLDEDTARPMISIFKRAGLGEIYQRLHYYFHKTNDSFTMSATDYQVNLEDKFSDYEFLKTLWKANGKLKPISEEEFRLNYPNDTTPGEPTVYFWISSNTIQLYPRPDQGYTIYASYYYRPNEDDLGELPKRWHNLVFYYIMMMYEAIDKMKNPEASALFTGLWQQSIGQVVTRAKPEASFDGKIILGDIESIIREQSADTSRSK